MIPPIRRELPSPQSPVKDAEWEDVPRDGEDIQAAALRHDEEQGLRLFQRWIYRPLSLVAKTIGWIVLVWFLVTFGTGGLQRTRCSMERMADTSPPGAELRHPSCG